MSRAAIEVVAPSEQGERALILEAAKAGTRDHWRVGAAVSRWLQRWAKGRAEADFSEAVNAENPDADFSPDYVRRCRNVFEAFPKRVGTLSWTHHLRALEGSAGGRDRAAGWLEQAQEKGWSVRELLAAMDTARAESQAAEFEVVSDDPAGASALGFDVSDDGGDDGEEAGSARSARARGAGDGDDAPFDPDDADGAARPRREASFRADESVEPVRITPAGVNEKVETAPSKTAAAATLLPDDAPPEEVGRWVTAVIEHPAMLLHHQVMRRPERLDALPARVRKELASSIDRLMTTLDKLKSMIGMQ